MKRAIKASIDIHVSPEIVWDVLMDFPSYPKWSKFLLSIEGHAIPGSRLQVMQTTASGEERVFSPVVLQVTPPTTFRWLERLGVPGLFDREHTFTLEYQFGGHTRVRQSEEFGGLLTPFSRRWFEPPTADEFTVFNRALKKRAESRR
jgi:hypothetical protein